MEITPPRHNLQQDPSISLQIISPRKICIMHHLMYQWASRHLNGQHDHSSWNVITSFKYACNHAHAHLDGIVTWRRMPKRTSVLRERSWASSMMMAE